jgi:hypothetical protein
MSMPGFTAEQAIYVSKARYRFDGFRPLAVKADIRPQIGPWWPDSWDCNPNCLCVWAINCPCCYSLGLPWPWPTRPV